MCHACYIQAVVPVEVACVLALAAADHCTVRWGHNVGICVTDEAHRPQRSCDIADVELGLDIGPGSLSIRCNQVQESLSIVLHVAPSAAGKLVPALLSSEGRTEWPGQ